MCVCVLVNRILTMESQQPQQPQTPIQQLPSQPIPQLAPQQPIPQLPPQPIPQNATCPNVVIPVPIVTPEDIYTYVAVKGSLHAQDCAIFGLNKEEIAALTKRFTNGSTEIVNGILLKVPPLDGINTLSKLGYKIICSTGDAEIVWTLQREL